MPKGFNADLSNDELMDAWANAAHRKEAEEVLKRVPHASCFETQQLVGKVRKALRKIDDLPQLAD